MSVFVVFTDVVHGVFSNLNNAERFIAATWPGAEKVDDQTWQLGSLVIHVEEFEVV